METVVSPAGTHLDVALASDGTVHIVTDKGDAPTHAWRPPEGGWSTQPIGGASGDYMHVEVDAADGVHATWLQANAIYWDVYHGYLPLDGVWTAEQAVFAVSICDLGLAIVGDTIQIPYCKDTNVGVASMTVGDAANWGTVVIDAFGVSTNWGGGTEGAAAPDGSGYAVYADGSGANNQLRLATRSTSGTWGSNYVDTGGMTVSGRGSEIAVDGLGGLHVSHDGDGGLNYSRRPNGSTNWSTELITADAVAETSTIGVDGFGEVHVLYRQTTTNALMYTHKPAGGSWTTPEPADAAAIQGKPRLAMAEDGHLHVAYLRAGGLQYARRTRCP